MSPFTLVLFLHVLGATIWTGGHLVLSLSVLPRAVRQADPSIVVTFESGFERLGIPALAVQVATGLWLAHRWLPDWSLWLRFGDAVASAIAVKLVLLLLTIGLAAHARLRIIPRLDRESLPRLATHIVAVTVLSVLFVLAGVIIRSGGL